MSNEDVVITITLGSEDPLTTSNGTASKEEAVTTSESKAIDGPPTIETDKETPLEVAQSNDPLTISNGTANEEEAVTTSESKAIDGEIDKETPLEVAQSNVFENGKKTFSIGEEVDEVTVVEKEDSLADGKLENDLVTNNAEGNSLKDNDRKLSLDENREPAELQRYEGNASDEKISLLSIYDCPLRESPSVYLPGLPVVAIIESNVISNRSRGPQFKVMLEHSVFTWTVYKYYIDFLSLRRDLAPLRSRIRLGRRGRGRQYGYLPHLFSLRDIHPLQAARTRTQLPKVRRFMNAVLSDRQMRTQECTVKFLEISRISFVEDLGSKRKEGSVTKRSGGHTRVTNCLGCGACCVCRCSVWRDRWLVMKDGYVAYLRWDNSIADALLFDEGMTVQTGVQQTHLRHGVKLNTRSRELLFKCPSHAAMKAWKDEFDRAMTTVGKVWVETKRFDSFAPPRTKCTARWFVDADLYMSSVAKALLEAKEEIFITDWMFSPHLTLVRDDPHAIDWRLDRILYKKAKEGVKIFIQLYKEITLAVDLGSGFTLENLKHPNIVIFRHPNHIQTSIFLWSHHEKIVVIDQTLAFMGGIDLCFGRYDNSCHCLTDHGRPPPHVKSVVELAKAINMSLGIEHQEHVDSPDSSSVPYQKWVGKDYYNPFVKDFIDLHKPHEDLIDRGLHPRMPWHDVAAAVYGAPARDLARHFIQRYNFTRHEQYENRGIPCLLPRRQFTEKEREGTNYLLEVIKGLSTDNTDVQVLRSVSKWSAGTPTEHSILNACLDTIENAEKFIYIENQFFISSLPNENVKNTFAEAVRQRIARAHNENQKFRVIIVMPLFPNFEGEIGEASGTLLAAVTHWNYRTISRGKDSLVGRLIHQDGIPEDLIENYISVFGVRTHGELDGQLLSEIVYVHSKCMIVDDKVSIIGSCNVNDRSLLGDRDSEMAIIVQDQELIDSKMDGKPYKVGRFSHSLRCYLFREHLGLLDQQVAHRSSHGQESSWSCSVEDPICDEFYHDSWIKNAKRNMEIFEEVFGGKNIPTDSVHSYEELKRFRKTSGLQQTDPDKARKLLQSTRGGLVPMPLDFLKNEANLLPEFGTIEFMAPGGLVT